MKNKLLKILTCFAGIFAIGSTITITSTSCGCSNQQSIKALPESVYDIDENNVLLGFKDAFLNDPTSPIYKDNFKNCDTMEIPARVTSIADGSFIDDLASLEPISRVPTFITKLTFAKESNCSSIGVGAFAFCKLSSITFSSGLTTIGDSAFWECSSLTSVDFSNCTNLSSIGSFAFYNCSKLTSITLPNGLTTIQNYAFKDCSSLTSITFPTDLTTIDAYTFEGCSSLTSVVFPDNLSQIGVQAFDSCSSLESITFPSSLRKIDADVFGYCSNLSSITWDSWNGSFESLSESAFSGVCPTRGTVTVTNPIGDNDSDKLLEYLLEHGGLPSTWAKEDGTKLPKTVYDIQDNVLMGFKDDFLNNPDSEIYKDNFQDCNTIEIPASVTSVANQAFYDLETDRTKIPSFVENLTFAKGSNCSSVGEYAFRYCKTLKSVSLSNTIKTLSKAAFDRCYSLTSITLPEGLEKIEIACFSNINRLSSIQLSSSLTTIGNYAFLDSGITKIEWNLPNQYETNISVGTDAFKFRNTSTTGIIKSLNPSIASSQQLLEWIRTKGSFPQTDWRPVD